MLDLLAAWFICDALISNPGATPMFFSIAEQTVVIDGNPHLTLTFRVNRADTAIVEMVVNHNGRDGPGVTVAQFKRNGGPTGTEFVPSLNEPLSGPQNDGRVRSSFDPANPTQKPPEGRLPGRNPDGTPFNADPNASVGSPLSGFRSVNDGAVRTDGSPSRNPDGSPRDTTVRSDGVTITPNR